MPPLQPMPLAPPPLTEIVHVVAPPLLLVVKLTEIALRPLAAAVPPVSVGGPIVRATVVAGAPAPAALTAFTVTFTGELSGKPASCAEVPVTVCVVPPAVIWYPVTGRPLFAAGCQFSAMVPLASIGTGVRLRGAPGTVNGTTVLDTGDGLDAVPRLLTAATMNAYCVP